VPELPVLDHETVLAAVSPIEAIERVREAFLRHHAGEWTMPAKVYLPSPPHGDFRAMPALGDGLALLKWVTSFPGNPERGLPTVTGVICLSDAETGEPLMLLDARSVTALRTGAAAAVASRALAREGASSVGLVGCGLHGLWTSRCLAAAGYREGVAHDPDAGAAERVARERAWRLGTLADALGCDVVCCVTTSEQPVFEAGWLAPGTHVNGIGAFRMGMVELPAELFSRATLVAVDSREAALAEAGDLVAAIHSGHVAAEALIEIGTVDRSWALSRDPEAITAFKSVGLAIQDVAAAEVVMRHLGAA